MPLSETTIRALKCGDKVRRVADERGLYLELAVSGAKLWRFKYRFEGREKRLAFGAYPEVGLRLARDRREEARASLARGVDPGALKRAQRAAAGDRAANSFEVITREFHAKQATIWAPGHHTRWLGRMVYDLFPTLGARPIATITAPDLLAVLRRVEPRAIETAHRLLDQSGQVFRYAIATGRAERDISADLRGALQIARVKHHAAATTPKELQVVLRAIHDYHASAVVSAALRFAPLVFQRPGEMRHAKWAEIDLDSDTPQWEFFSSKKQHDSEKRKHIVPLSRQAAAILRDLQPLTSRSPYVFPGARSPKRPMSDNAVLVAMRSMEITKDMMTGHGFRASARTILDEVLGFRADIIEHQLGHAVRDPNGRAYNRTSFLPERREMMQRWADYLDELRTGVIAFPKRA